MRGVSPLDVQVLVVDDDPFVRNLLSRWICDAGYQCVTADGHSAAREHLRRQPTHLVILDITLPGGSGLDLLDEFKQQSPDSAVLMLTAEDSTAKAVRALTAGACGYLIKPVEREELLAQVRNGLERRRLDLDNRQYTHRLEEKVRDQTSAIRSAHEETIYRLTKASLCRDEETGAHITRTGLYSELLAAAIGWSGEHVDLIRLAAPMHDIGKIGIPDAILRKPGKLSIDEYAVMRTHTHIGANMLADSQSPVLRMAQAIALSHHEHWIGTGYPSQLRAHEIPEAARIVAIVDVYDALTHDRVYRRALPEPEVLRIMREARGRHFDPKLFDAFLTLLPEMRAIAEVVVDDRQDDAPVVGYDPALPCSITAP